MSKRCFIISICILAGFASAAFGEDAKPKLKGPIVITAEMLTADNKAHTALFEKNVVAKTDATMLSADRMLVFYDAETGDVSKIDATGAVRLLKDERLITADQALYFAGEDKVIFTGSPKAMDRENVITGTSMTYYISDDRSVVENSRVILRNSAEQNGPKGER